MHSILTFKLTAHLHHHSTVTHPAGRKSHPALMHMYAFNTRRTQDNHTYTTHEEGKLLYKKRNILCDRAFPLSAGGGVYLLWAGKKRFLSPAAPTTPAGGGRGISYWTPVDLLSVSGDKDLFLEKV